MSHVNSLKIGLLNINGLKGNFDLMTLAAAQVDLELVCLTETWLTPRSSIPTGIIAASMDMTPYRRGVRATRGVAVYNRAGLDITVIAVDNTSNCFSIVAVGNLTICTFYLPPTMPWSECQTMLDTAMAKARSTGLDTIVMGDFNSRHSAFGDRIDTEKGACLFEWMNLNNGMHISMGSNISLRRISGAQVQSSLVDLILYFSSRQDRSIGFSETRTHSSLKAAISDHLLISFKVDAQVRKAQPITRINFESLQDYDLASRYGQAAREKTNFLGRIIEDWPDATTVLVKNVLENFSLGILEAAITILGTYTLNKAADTRPRTKASKKALRKLREESVLFDRVPSK